MSLYQRKLRMGMIGGGTGAFIGAVHRLAANLDGQNELVCGAFSSDPNKSKQTGEELFLDPSRVYGSYLEMIEKEASLPDDLRMDFVSIVTPNHVHAEPAMLALDHGFSVMIDKPLCFNYGEALAIKKKVEETGLLLGLTHTYTGYPMVKEARQIIKSTKLGSVRKVVMEYPQGWLAEKLEDSDQKQAAWRTDPSKSGKSGAYGDIGTHATNMGEYVTGLKITKVLSQLSTVVSGRLLDDDANAFVEFEGGIPGILSISQISAGEENAIKVRVYCEKGGIYWTQRDPNTLNIMWNDGANEVYRTGSSYVSKAAQANSRTPAGHPEGYLEAFANIYRNFVMHLRAKSEGKDHDFELYDYPGIDDGVHGMRLIDAFVESTQLGNTWINV